MIAVVDGYMYLGNTFFGEACNLEVFIPEFCMKINE